MNNELIIIIDLDGTIIGNCYYQSEVYNIDNIHKKFNIKSISNNNLNNSYKENSKLIRPYFTFFYKNIKKKYPNSLFFIYTASDDKWAKKEITLIEKNFDIKFNRPILSRKDCILNSNNEYKKSFTKILPKIKKHIKNINDINDNLLIIDNNNTFIDYHQNFIKCKSYNYIHFIDLWDSINKNFYKYNELNNYINYLINTNKIFKYYDKNNEKKIEQYLKWKYKKYKKINKNNKKDNNDIFWKNITNIIINNNFDKFDKDTIYKINKFISN